MIEEENEKESPVSLTPVCNWSRAPTCYDEKYCNAIVHHCSAGNTYASFALFVGVSRQTLIGWADKHEEFKEAYKVAQEAQMVYWENIAKAQATGTSKGNAVSMLFTMKNRFKEDYKDVQSVEHMGDLTFLIDTGIKRNQLPDVEQPVPIESTVLEDDSELL